MSDIAEELIDAPAFVELMGHRQIAGYARTVLVAGAGMIRIVTPALAGGEESRQYVSPGAIYDLHIVDEATMLAAITRLAGRGTPSAITAAPWISPIADDVVDAHVCEHDACHHSDDTFADPW